jgi:hypothetical protein
MKSQVYKHESVKPFGAVHVPPWIFITNTQLGIVGSPPAIEGQRDSESIESVFFE